MFLFDTCIQQRLSDVMFMLCSSINVIQTCVQHRYSFARNIRGRIKPQASEISFSNTHFNTLRSLALCHVTRETFTPCR